MVENQFDFEFDGHAFYFEGVQICKKNEYTPSKRCLLWKKTKE
jgi:hypothetical protein